MNDRKTYRVQEFARLAGVTVRTLHYYDEAGLLKPAGRTDSRHRLYQQTDLLRLQQILTLKYLGFSLEDIQAMLDSPLYDMPGALRAQKTAIEERVLQLQGVIFALAQTIEALEAERAVDWAGVVGVIQALSDSRRGEWLRQYFPAEQWAWLQTRAAAMPPPLAELGTNAWTDLIAAFKAVRHLPPDHADVQVLAERMARLVEMFTQGDPAVERGLQSMYRNFEQMPAMYRGDLDQDLHTFMGQALTLYRERDNRGEAK